MVAQSWRILVQHLKGRLYALGVDDELGEVLAAELWLVACHKAWRTATHKGRNTRDAFVFGKGITQGLSNGSRLFQPRTLRKIDLAGKLIAVGKGELPELERGEDERGQDDQYDATAYRQPRVTERPLQSLKVIELYTFGYAAFARFPLLHLLDETHVKSWNDAGCYDEAYHQANGDGGREVADNVASFACHREENRVEDSTDANGSQKHRHEVLLDRHDGCFLPVHAIAKVLEVSIDDDNAIIHYHAKHNDERGKRDDVKRYAK